MFRKRLEYCGHSPPEIAVFIFCNVPLRDFGRIAISCKTWNDYLNEESTWKKIYELKYDTSQINNSLHQSLPWRQLVRAQCSK
jgi:hypothetical protein